MSITPEEMHRLKDAIFIICKTAATYGFKLLSIPLSKAIFLSDRETYFSTAKPLIADAYIRGQFGPYLEGLRTASEELAQARSILLTKQIYPGHTKPFTEYSLGCAADDYQTSSFTAAEIRLLERITIDVLTEESPLSAAMATHNHAWQITQDKEPIPLAAQVLTDPAPVTQDDIRWAKEFMGVAY